MRIFAEMHKPAKRRQALKLALRVPIVSLVLSSQGSLLLAGHTSLPSHSPALATHKEVQCQCLSRSTRRQQRRRQALVLCVTA
jgi:hypothetical protein